MGIFSKKKKNCQKAIDHLVKLMVDKTNSENKYFMSLNENCDTDKGIGVMTSFYIMNNPFADKIKDYETLYKFINSYKKKYQEENNLSDEDVIIKFINYGEYELVYLLEDVKSNKSYALLVKQPEIPYGLVKVEHDNLLSLSKKDACVVAPVDYYSDDVNELYVTPYIPYARCIGNDDVWGMYVPEPYYRFERFSDEQESVVNSCMIAKLVSLYDFDNKCGIACCRIGCGDFMLKQGWENEELNIQNTLDSLYLIALRNQIICEFEEYLDLIREEFSISTHGFLDVVINKNNRVEMKKDDIEKGIELGISLIKR